MPWLLPCLPVASGTDVTPAACVGESLLPSLSHCQLSRCEHPSLARGKAWVLKMEAARRERTWRGWCLQLLALSLLQDSRKGVCVRARACGGEERWFPSPPWALQKCSWGPFPPWRGSHQMGMAKRSPCPAAGCHSPSPAPHTQPLAGMLGSWDLLQTHCLALELPMHLCHGCRPKNKNIYI